ncbi:uncharacterized protein LOC131538472 [Onychostoma macrolepis]|uniref:uncharacterized protein LOC131538472 n=1 Tax=Onychostoma macrolepis TaxID=369639 RepID=UPI00272CCF52|nr:uncharacterized protein LOC131538472 [Onychostoma macrolepis]
MTRKTLRLKVQDTFENMKSALIQKLNNAEYVATTADCWSARQRSYLGVTCHWIDSTSLERCSAALACRRMTGSHTFDVIAAALKEIHKEYKIRGKITRTTTDSGSNFLKAFRIYGEDKKDDAQDAQEEEDFILEEESDESESEMEYQDLFGILDEDCGLEYQLPRHQKCACHLLNLVATVDASAAEAGSDTYKRLSRSAFAKCSALWNKTSRSALAFETVERECKLQFLRPNQTRWNSLFLAVERLVRIQREQGEHAIRNVCTALKIKMLNTAELGFLAEYSIVMKPVAMALNLLQGESSVHMGFLLPTLQLLQLVLQLVESTCKVCQPLLKALHGGILKRFGEFITGLDYIKDQLELNVENDALCYSSPSDEEDFFASMKTGHSETGELERWTEIWPEKVAYNDKSLNTCKREYTILKRGAWTRLVRGDMEKYQNLMRTQIQESKNFPNVASHYIDIIGNCTECDAQLSITAEMPAANEPVVLKCTIHNVDDNLHTGKAKRKLSGDLRTRVSEELWEGRKQIEKTLWQFWACSQGDHIPVVQRAGAAAPKEAVCDFSLTLLGELVKAFTPYPDLKTYINQCFGVLTKKPEDSQLPPSSE